MKKYFYFKTSGYKIISTIFLILSFFYCTILLLNCKEFKKTSINLSNAKINLGRYLFYDRRLSVNNTRSCATCHNPQFAFTDGYKRSLGAFADLHQRNTQPIFNVAYLKYFTAADSTLHSPLQQMDNPLFSTHPVEMGVNGNELLILKRIIADETYKKLFTAAGLEVSWSTIKLTISAFISTLQSNQSPYDKFINGDTTVLTSSQLRGKQLFFSTNFKCATCHGGFNFSSPSLTNNNGDTLFYFNTGLYNIDNKNGYPLYDEGLFTLTKNKDDIGKFRVPTLRNLAFTAPYFHDGSAASLSEVINSYAAGGREINTGIYKGDGTANQNKHPAISGFVINGADKINLINFLLSLSDPAFIQNPIYQNPFAEDETEKKY